MQLCTHLMFIALVILTLANNNSLWVHRQQSTCVAKKSQIYHNEDCVCSFTDVKWLSSSHMIVVKKKHLVCLPNCMYNAIIGHSSLHIEALHSYLFLHETNIYFYLSIHPSIHLVICVKNIATPSPFSNLKHPYIACSSWKRCSLWIDMMSNPYLNFSFSAIYYSLRKKEKLCLLITNLNLLISIRHTWALSEWGSLLAV